MELETPERLHAKLRDAALTGDLQVVTALIANGIDTQTKDPKVCADCLTGSMHHYTASIFPQLTFTLCSTVCLRAPVCSIALRDIHSEQDGQTALSNACAYGHLQIVKLLLAASDNSREKEVEATSNNGNTPLMLAAKYGQVDVAKLLVASGASLHAKNKDGQSALDMAYVQEGNPGTLEVAIFLELKQDVSVYIPATNPGWGVEGGIERNSKLACNWVDAVVSAPNAFYASFAH